MAGKKEFQQEIEECEMMRRSGDAQLPCDGMGEEKCDACGRLAPKKSSELWAEVREILGVRHFRLGEDFGSMPGKVIARYLESGHWGKPSEGAVDVISQGALYKAVKRQRITVFYDEAGGTLFDVTNERLKMEQGRLTVEAAARARKESGRDSAKPEIRKGGIKEAAEKLKSALLNADSKGNAYADKAFAEACIGYLLRRCEESESLAMDVCQEHKSWEKCKAYVMEKAKESVPKDKRFGAQSVCVSDETVFEWTEDYFRLDDKEQEEKKAREEAERKQKEAERKKQAAEKAAKAKGGKRAAAQAAVKTEAPPKEAVKAKPKKGEMDGQMDFLAMVAG